MLGSPHSNRPWLPVVLSFLALAGAPLMVHADQEEDRPPTPEEIAALAEAAENAPLFASHHALIVTLEADIEDLKRERDEDIERVGTFTFPGPDDQPMTVSVKLTTRGIFRLDKRNCNFPPLRLDLPKGRVQGTIFDGQNRLKLVAPCNDERDDYQRYVLLEYLAYRTFNLMTSVSYRVRLLQITLKDTSGKNEDRTKYAFLIEDVDRLAERNFAEESEWEQFHPGNMEHHQAALVAVFQYMIGNTDWSPVYFHNIKMILGEGLTYLVIPYDFDFSGAVDARYATPNPDVGIRRVRDRVYRGFCRDELDFAPLYGLFIERKDSIYVMVQGLEELEEKQRKRLLDYYDDFYDVISNEGKARRQIQQMCRRV